MIGFRASRETIDATLTSVEAAMIDDLATQLIVMLEDRAQEHDSSSPLSALGIEEGPSTASDDPALVRLLPQAHADDAEASAEFRRLTEPALVAAKLHNAALVRAAVQETGSVVRVQLDETAAHAWLRTLTDLRLVIASRLGILLDDDDVDSDDPHDLALAAAYDWLGWVQGSLLEAVESREG